MHYIIELWKSMETIIVFLSLLIFVTILILLYVQFRTGKFIQKVSNDNQPFLESIEKYVEIFNEHNIKEITGEHKSQKEALADEQILNIRSLYRNKLISQNTILTDEHEMLIDFVTLSLSLLIKTPPNLRERLINENTDNDVIKKILISKLPSIEKHYIPVSILEIALSKDED